jgi:hypothetical protein
VHRVPVLRSGVPLLGAAVQLRQADLPKEQLNPNMSYLSNRPREKGVMEKCHFCLHRTREGRMPGVPGDLPDRAPASSATCSTRSEVSEILKTKRVFVLKEEVGTLPRFFYYFDERYPNSLDPEALAIADTPEGRGGRCLRRLPGAGPAKDFVAAATPEWWNGGCA